MALKMIRGDIVTMECDAIVNATNSDMYPSGGVDLAIHRAAGDLGISRERAIDWNADGEGVHVLYECTSAYIGNVRRGKKYSRDVFEEVDRDFNERKQ